MLNLQEISRDQSASADMALDAEIASAEATDFGLAIRSWRAFRKFSQLELALTCSSSQRHISFLESGRAMPSRQMVNQLCEALEVPIRDRNLLYVAAGFAPVYKSRTIDDPALSSVRQSLLGTLQRHMPFPAIVIDRDYNVLLSNRAFDQLIAMFGEPSELWGESKGSGDRNLMRLVFHPNGLRHRIANFDDVAPTILRRACNEALKSGRMPVDVLPGFPELPLSKASSKIVSEDDNPAVMPFVLDAEAQTIRLFTMIAEFALPNDNLVDELRIETYFPFDDATEHLFQELAATSEQMCKLPA